MRYLSSPVRQGSEGFTFAIGEYEQKELWYPGLSWRCPWTVKYIPFKVNTPYTVRPTRG
jgi:hypothetical protein